MGNDNLPQIIGEVLDWAYERAVDGFGVLNTAEELASDYIREGVSLVDAANNLIKAQDAKAATAGFISNLGGMVTLPITVPADLSSTLYIQLRMIAAIAAMAGYDVHNDRVKTLCYTCLAGDSVNEIFKKIGVQLGEKFSQTLLQKIPGKLFVEINKQVGFRLLTKAGNSGVINVAKFIPFVGGTIGAAFNAFTTNSVGNAARDWFVGSQNQI